MSCPRAGRRARWSSASGPTPRPQKQPIGKQLRDGRGDDRYRVVGTRRIDWRMPKRSSHRQRVCVFAPAPLLTVTVESKPDGSHDDEVHLHAGGQGFWIGRLIAELGVDVVLCGSFGGETGRVARALIDDQGVAVRGIASSGNNGAYVHDRRSGERVEVASMPGDPLTRHELDELYGIVLLEGIESAVTVLGGPTGPPIVPPSTYRRLATDLRANGSKVVADLSGDPLARPSPAGSTCSRSARRS